MMLGAVFTAVIIVGGAFLAWTYTKSGKKWLENL